MVSFDGANYFVVWTLFSKVFGRRISEDGVCLDSTPLIIQSDHNVQAVVFNGSDFLVAATSSINSNSEVCITQVAPSGKITQTSSIPLKSDLFYDPRSLALTRGINGRHCIVYSGWTDSINSHRGDAFRIKAAYFDPDNLIDIKQDATHHRLFARLKVLQSSNHSVIFSVTGLERFYVNTHPEVKLDIFNASGRLMHSIGCSITPENQSARIVWDGKNSRGARLPSGIYFIRLKLGKQIVTRKFFMQ